MLALLLAAAAGFGGGWLTGRGGCGPGRWWRGRAAEPGLTAGAATADQPAPAAPAGLPAPGAEPADPADRAAAAAKAAEAVLREFLAAPGWAARSVHVLHREQLREAMARHAAAHGDGPLAATGIALLRSHADGIHFFQVRTARIPDGFPVTVAETPDGCLVDWETFVEFHDDLFKAFADGPVGATGVFHLLVNRDDAAGDDPAFACFRLSPPAPGRARPARVRRASPTWRRLDRIFEDQRNFDRRNFEQLVAANGLPLVLAVARRETPARVPCLEIEDVIAVGWNPAPP